MYQPRRFLALLLLASFTSVNARAAVSEPPEKFEVQNNFLVERLPAFPYSTLPMQIVNVNSGKCLDVAGAGTGDNVNVQQFDCIDVANEEWWILPVATTRYQIRSGHVGRCLNPAGGSSANNTNVQQFSCAGAPEAEHWEFFGLPDGSFEIRAAGTAQCLDIAGGATENGANAQIFECIGVRNKQWRLVPRLDADNVIMARHSNLCLSSARARPFRRSTVVQAKCKGDRRRAFDQRWNFEDAGNGYFRIKAKRTENCLDSSRGTIIRLIKCTATNHQKWSFEEDAETDYFEIKTKAGGKCLTVLSGSAKPGRHIVQMTCRGEDWQRWRVGYFTLRSIHQFAVAAADGADRRVLEEFVIDLMVDRLNSVYKRVGVRTTYSEVDGDLTAVNDDALYNLGSTGTFLCKKNMQMMVPSDCANLYAADYPDKVVVFPDGGFSDVGLKFMAIVYPNRGRVFDSQPCEFNDINLAHEFGHYLGLQHTFSASGSESDLSAALQAANDDQFKAFDSDGLSDTPPEPLLEPDIPNTCSSRSKATTLTLQGTAGPVEVTVPLRNTWDTTTIEGK